MAALQNLRRLVINGAPGSGKGTISAWIVRDFKVQYLAAGDLLRSNIAKKTVEGQEAASYICKGKLVPDDLISKLMIKELKQVNDKSWLLDGYPRTLKQARDLSNFCPIDHVIDIIVPFEEIINRVKGRLIHVKSGRVYNTEYNPPKVPNKDDVTGENLVQREDDKPEVIKVRLESYQSQTDPIISYYKNQGLVTQFHGTSSDKIYLELQKFLVKIFEK